jgi:hypothetical protein
MARAKRADAFIDADTLLASMLDCRRDLIRSIARMEIGGSLYLAANDLLTAMDAVAVALGKRADHFHEKAHGRR